MRKRHLYLITSAFITILILSGCYEVRQHFILNPDGSGKLNVEIISGSPLGLSGGDKNNVTDNKAKREVTNLINNSEGIDAWNNVSYKYRDDGKLIIKGTAYFKNITKVKFQKSNWNIKLVKAGNKTMVLRIKVNQGSRSNKSLFSGITVKDEKITKNTYKKTILKYKRTRSLLAQIFNDNITEVSFELPGRIIKNNIMKRKNDNTLMIVVDGKKVISAMDLIFDNEKTLQNIMKPGADKDKVNEALQKRFIEKIYGTSDPITATIKGPFRNKFSYKKEVLIAKKGMAALMSKFHRVKRDLGPPAKGQPLKNIKVGGIEIVYYTDKKNGVQPLNMYEPSYNVAIVAQFPGSVLSVKECVLEKAVANNGSNMLSIKKWKQRSTMPRLSKDKSVITFRTQLKVPDKSVKFLREISGYIDYFSGHGSKKYILQNINYFPGTKNKVLGFHIDKIRTSTFKRGWQMITFFVNRKAHEIKSIKFYDDRNIELYAMKNSIYDDYIKGARASYSVKESFPQKGKIEIVLFDKVKRYKVPFKLQNIDLLGKTVK